METISIILPVYNVEKYLETCLKSLLSQTYTKLEIILVNDGSKDKSLEICQDYALKDSRIKVIDKPNEGVAMTRNKGLEVATGKYIAFVDPDDWVEPQMYESLLSQIQKWESPVCLCNFFKDTKRRSQPKCFEFEDEVLESSEIVEKLVNDMIGMSDLLPRNPMIMGSVWRGLYEKAFLTSNRLAFVPKISIMEDLVFMVQVLLKCVETHQKVAIDQNAWYHYVQHPHSALRSYNHQLWEDQLMVYDQLEKSLKEANLEEEMRNRLDIRYIGMVLTAIKNETYAKKEGDLKESITRIKEIFNDETLRCVLERVKPIQVDKTTEKEKNHMAHEVKETNKERKVRARRNSRVTSLYKESKDRYNE